MLYSPTASHRFGQHYTSSVNSLKDSFQIHPPCDLSYQYRCYPFWSKFLVNTKEVNFNHQDSPRKRVQMDCISQTQLRSSTKLQHSMIISNHVLQGREIQGIFTVAKMQAKLNMSQCSQRSPPFAYVTCNCWLFRSLIWWIEINFHCSNPMFLLQSTC